MKIFAISDLHVSTFDKPMGIFGDHWINHFEKIKSDWLSKVTDEDIVILAGDICWAMNMEEANSDYSLFIGIHYLRCRRLSQIYILYKIMPIKLMDIYFVEHEVGISRIWIQPQKILKFIIEK